MTAAALLVLAIIDKALAIALEIAQSMPESSKAAFWARHEKNMEFWQTLFERLSGQPAEPDKPAKEPVKG